MENNRFYPYNRRTTSQRRGTASRNRKAGKPGIKSQKLPKLNSRSRNRSKQGKKRRVNKAVEISPPKFKTYNKVETTNGPNKFRKFAKPPKRMYSYKESQEEVDRQYISKKMKRGLRDVNRGKKSVSGKTTYMSRLRQNTSKKAKKLFSQKFRQIPRDSVIQIFEFSCENFGDYFQLILVNKTWWNILSKSLTVWRYLKRILQKRFTALRKIDDRAILDYNELRNLVQKFYFREKLKTIDIFLKKSAKLFDYNSTRVIFCLFFFNFMRFLLIFC